MTSYEAVEYARVIDVDFCVVGTKSPWYVEHSLSPTQHGMDYTLVGKSIHYRRVLEF
jgi:hypothetical protein